MHGIYNIKFTYTALKINNDNREHKTVDTVCNMMLLHSWMKLTDVQLSILYVAMCVETSTAEAFSPKGSSPCAVYSAYARHISTRQRASSFWIEYSDSRCFRAHNHISIDSCTLVNFIQLCINVMLQIVATVLCSWLSLLFILWWLAFTCMDCLKTIKNEWMNEFIFE
jgi:hypothetical protein